MAVCRESLNLKTRWKYGGKTYGQKIKQVLSIIKKLNDKYYRKIFILDNFITPYYKMIGCKIKPHTFRFNEDGYFCTKCSKWLTEKQYFQYNRFQKIQKIKTNLKIKN